MNEKTKCSICDWELEQDEIAIAGCFGIIPVAFCDTCFTCMLDMAEQVLDTNKEE